MNRRYEEYLKTVEGMIQSGVLKGNFTPKSFREWHREDYTDRVEEYYMREYNGKLFCEEAWPDNISEEEGDKVYHEICDIVEKAYRMKLPVNEPARLLSKLFSYRQIKNSVKNHPNNF